MTKAIRKEGNKERKSKSHKYFKTETKKRLCFLYNQIIFCSKHSKKEKTKYYENLDMKKTTDNTKCWKTAASFFLRSN